MNAGRVDAIVDLAYGILIFVSIVLIVAVGTTVGLAFGFGVLTSYVIHVVWKMARFDPEWMTQEVTDEVTEEVTESVERTVGEQLDEIGDRLEEVNERIDRRPKSEEFDEKIEEVTEEVTEKVETETDDDGGSAGR